MSPADDSETQARPSNETAAQAGDLRTGVAWGALLAGLLGLWAFTAVTERVALFRQVPLTKSPELLTERAREILSKFGHDGKAYDSAFGFIVNDGSLDDLARRRPAGGGWEHIRLSRPGPFAFYYHGPLGWYAGRSFVVLGGFVLALAGAAYFSLGGKPLFGKTLLDD